MLIWSRKVTEVSEISHVNVTARWKELTKPIILFWCRMWLQDNHPCSSIDNQSDPETAPIFLNPPLVSFKRDWNLRNSLVRSSLPSNLEPGTFNCSRKVCNTCPFINSKTHIQGPKRLYQVNDHFDCTTSNIIYCITCTLCNKLYIGESGRKIGDRLMSKTKDQTYLNPWLDISIFRAIRTNTWKFAEFNEQPLFSNCLCFCFITKRANTTTVRLLATRYRTSSCF